MVFHWNLRNIKSQVSRVLLSILADLNNFQVFKSNLLKIVPSALITIVVTVMFFFFGGGVVLW